MADPGLKLAFFCDTFGRRISRCHEHWYNILSIQIAKQTICATTMINAFDGASWKSPGFLLHDRIIRSIFSIANFRRVQQLLLLKSFDTLQISKIKNGPRKTCDVFFQRIVVGWTLQVI